MQSSELKQEIKDIIFTLPYTKLKVLIDFANYLRNKEEEFLRMQSNSKAYHEWVSTENDIYDSVFNGEI